MKTTYHNNLPHYQPLGGIFFVTFRLHGSIPAHVIETLQKAKHVTPVDRKTKSTYVNKAKKYFAAFDAYLDNNLYEPQWLKERKVAEIVKSNIHKFDKKYYDLVAYCIMPNHVHLIVDTAIQLLSISELEIEKLYTQLYKILRLIKGASAHEANKVLNRNGAFWQKESYDHVVKDDLELENVINYTLQNPVKAGLVENWEKWPFSYVNNKYLFNVMVL